MRKTLYVSPKNNLVEFLGSEFNIITEAECHNDVTNFDAAIFFDNHSHALKVYCDALNIPYMGTERYGKDVQSLILNKLKIKTPKTYFELDKGLYSDVLFYKVCKDIPDNVPIILKEKHGARSMGIAKLTNKDVFYKFLYVCHDEINGTGGGIGRGLKKKLSLNRNRSESRDDCGVAKDSRGIILPKVTDYCGDVNDNVKYYGRCHTEDDVRRCADFITQGQFVVQEIENVKSEFRMMWFGSEDDYILNRRHKEKFSNKRTEDHLESDLFKRLKQEMIYTSKGLCKHLNTPWLSIDFYVTDDNELGVFEFQMEMGFTDVNKTDIVKCTINSVKRMMGDL